MQGGKGSKLHEFYFRDSEKLIPFAKLYSNDRDGSNEEQKQFIKVLNIMDLRGKRKLP